MEVKRRALVLVINAHATKSSYFKGDLKVVIAGQKEVDWLDDWRRLMGEADWVVEIGVGVGVGVGAKQKHTRRLCTDCETLHDQSDTKSCSSNFDTSAPTTIGLRENFGVPITAQAKVENSDVKGVEQLNQRNLKVKAKIAELITDRINFEAPKLNDH